jgi:hypothetical protein
MEIVVGTPTRQEREEEKLDLYLSHIMPKIYNQVSDVAGIVPFFR